MKIEFQVRGSDGLAIYPVELSVDNGMLHVYCGCPAGILGKWCKHKMSLVSGDYSAVVGGFEQTDINDVLAWIGKSEFPQLLDELKSAENETLAAKKKMDNVKRALEKAAKEGMKI